MIKLRVFGRNPVNPSQEAKLKFVEAKNDFDVVLKMKMLENKKDFKVDYFVNETTGETQWFLKNRKNG